MKELAILLNAMRDAGVLSDYALFGAAAQMRDTARSLRRSAFVPPSTRRRRARIVVTTRQHGTLPRSAGPSELDADEGAQA